MEYGVLVLVSASRTALLSTEYNLTTKNSKDIKDLHLQRELESTNGISVPPRNVIILL